jgi:hypothetical protein
LVYRGRSFVGVGSKRVEKEKQIPLAEWQRMGFDTHSAFVDPLFVDPLHDDYRLRPDSPALKMGFQPTDVSQIGPRNRFKQESGIGK